MDKMKPMSSHLGGDNNKTSDPTNLDTGDDNGLRKLTSHLENRRLPDSVDEHRLTDRMDDRRLTDRMDDDPLDTHIGEERAAFDNKTDEMEIPNEKANLVSEESILDDLKIFVPPRISDYTTLMRFLQTHVVELRFTRRHPRGNATSRKMVCTANWRFLSSVFTRWFFKWNTPKSRRGVSWYKRRNLIIVWDLMVQNFRIIPVGDIRFVSAYKCTSLMEKGRFLLFYRNNIRNINSVQEEKYFQS